VEGEFPPELNVYGFEFKPGWKIDFKKDDRGKIIGATWTGTKRNCDKRPNPTLMTPERTRH
jgi:hypothetical protein